VPIFFSKHKITQITKNVMKSLNNFEGSRVINADSLKGGYSSSYRGSSSCNTVKKSNSCNPKPTSCSGTKDTTTNAGSSVIIPTGPADPILVL
jgi:hypothetical protein